MTEIDLYDVDALLAERERQEQTELRDMAQRMVELRAEVEALEAELPDARDVEHKAREAMLAAMAELASEQQRLRLLQRDAGHLQNKARALREQRDQAQRELAELEARWRREEALSSAPVVRSWPHARRRDR